VSTPVRIQTTQAIVHSHSTPAHSQSSAAIFQSAEADIQPSSRSISSRNQPRSPSPLFSSPSPSHIPLPQPPCPAMTARATTNIAEDDLDFDTKFEVCSSYIVLCSMYGLDKLCKKFVWPRNTVLMILCIRNYTSHTNVHHESRTAIKL
jgi:hypothetical protein